MSFPMIRIKGNESAIRYLKRSLLRATKTDSMSKSSRLTLSQLWHRATINRKERRASLKIQKSNPEKFRSKDADDRTDFTPGNDKRTAEHSNAKSGVFEDNRSTDSDPAK